MKIIGIKFENRENIDKLVSRKLLMSKAKATTPIKSAMMIRDLFFETI